MTILEILGLIWLAIIIYCIFEAYFLSQVENDNIEEIQYTCCGVEIKDEVIGGWIIITAIVMWLIRKLK